MAKFATFAGESLSSLFISKGGGIEPGLVVCEVLVYINGWYENVLLWGKRFIGEKH